jgi:lactoylglutathione lyase
MRIEHACLQVCDLEKERSFYVTYLDLISGSRYANPKTGWSSYFLFSPEGGARLEIRSHPNLLPSMDMGDKAGFSHLAFALGSQKAVDALAERLRRDGYPVLSGPRVTGDGYYEAAALDPEGNMIELTV